MLTTIIILFIVFFICELVRKLITYKKFRIGDYVSTLILFSVVVFGCYITSTFGVCNDRITSSIHYGLFFFIIYFFDVAFRHDSDKINKKFLLSWAGCLPVVISASIYFFCVSFNNYDKLFDTYNKSTPVVVEDVKTIVKEGNEILILQLSNDEDISLSVAKFPLSIFKTQKNDTIKYLVYDGEVVFFSNRSKK